MTERGRRSIAREAQSYRIGPSSLHWDGTSLLIEIDEIAVPMPRRVRGSVRVTPHGLSNFVAALDADGKHRWGPIGPCSTVHVSMESPRIQWRGHAYLDSNEGDEPIDRPFVEWDWSRATLADGSCAVIYDVREKSGAERVIARRFAPNGESQMFPVGARMPLERSKWLIARSTRAQPGTTARLEKSMEDTPFYARALVRSQLCGEQLVSVHETLNLPRLKSLPVQLMLPWRMPRRA
jgi:carotenoid 1,2-hydratase